MAKSIAKFYLGKLSPNDTDFDKKEYTGSLKTSYLNKGYKIKEGKIERGDYVFPVYRTNISELWKVAKINKDNDGSNNNDPKVTIKFERIESFNKIKLQDFVKCNYFELDEILIYRQQQNTKENFFQLTLTEKVVKKHEDETKENLKKIVEKYDKKNKDNSKEFNKFKEFVKGFKLEDGIEKLKNHISKLSLDAEDKEKLEKILKDANEKVENEIKESVKDIENNLRRIYMTDKEDNNNYKKGDINVEVKKVKGKIYKITQFREYADKSFQKYDRLQKLFEKRKNTKEDILKTLNQRFYKDYEINESDVTLDGIRKLAQSNIDNRENTSVRTIQIADKKKQYIDDVLKKLDDNNKFEISDVRDLYGYVIAGVGHFKSPPVRDEKTYDYYIELLENDLNLILFGPPGTGKTYTAHKIVIKKEMKEINDNGEDQEEKSETKILDDLIKDGRFEFITFHQSFSYEEFIEGIRPILKNQEKESNLTYEINNGVLKRIANKAKNSKKLNHYLIIDELNGGDPVRVFGELFTLIDSDKRSEHYKVTLPYSREKFSIPNNLYIIATMNTADKTSTVFDAALRRRFFFYELEPDSELIIGNDEKGNINQEDSDNNSKSTIDLRKIMDTLNDRITSELDRDRRIGHAFFMKIESVKDLEAAWYLKIIPLLMDYFYNDNEKIKEIMGEDFVPNKQGKIDRLEGDKFIKALKKRFKDAIKNNSNKNG